VIEGETYVMERGIQIRVSAVLSNEREELLQALEADIRETDPTVSMSAIDAYTLVDPNLLQFIIHTASSLDPASLAAGAGAGVVLSRKTLRRIFQRLARFAGQVSRPLKVHVGEIEVEVPHDTTAKALAELVAKISAIKSATGDASDKRGRSRK
jgi:hypothetical protein